MRLKMKEDKDNNIHRREKDGRWREKRDSNDDIKIDIYTQCLCVEMHHYIVLRPLTRLFVLLMRTLPRKPPTVATRPPQCMEMA